jgi:hypothetical protein
MQILWTTFVTRQSLLPFGERVNRSIVEVQDEARFKAIDFLVKSIFRFAVRWAIHQV